jgi:catechol 2,3-dioxygenase-like lactoylglutathione lyase family enzyme
MPPVRVDDWRAGVAPFPSVRVDDGTIIDLVPATDLDGDRGHVDHICLVVGEGDVDAVATDPAFNVVDGPGPRFGARGVATSVYVTDPDGLTVEFRTYPPM